MDILIFCREGYADLHKSDKQFLWVNRTGSERRRDIYIERDNCWLQSCVRETLCSSTWWHDAVAVAALCLSLGHWLRLLQSCTPRPRPGRHNRWGHTTAQSSQPQTEVTRSAGHPAEASRGSADVSRDMQQGPLCVDVLESLPGLSVHSLQLGLCVPS